MQPRFAALLFVLGLADLAYVNLGLGHEVFGDGAGAASGPAKEDARSPTPLAPAPALEAPRPAPSPAPEPPAPVAAPSPAANAPPSSAVPANVPAPTEAEPSAPHAVTPPPEAVALPAPAPTAQGAPGAAREPAPPSAEPSPTEGAAPSAPAPAADVPGAIHPAQAAIAAPATSPSLAEAERARAEESAAPIASAAGLPDAEVTVAFPDTASVWLTGDAHAQLMALAAKLRANPEYRIHIVGHADARGSREFNRELGARRARTVTELLARAGVPRVQLQMDSRGEDDPKAPGESEQDWAANRRVEITIGTERTTSP